MDKKRLNSTVKHLSDTNGQMGDDRGTTDARYQWNACIRSTNSVSSYRALMFAVSNFYFIKCSDKR